MGKKKNNWDDNHAEDAAAVPGTGEPATYEVVYEPDVSRKPAPPPPRRPVLPALGIGDILALLALIVLSAALLLEGYYKEFNYSKEIIALFAVVVGFLLGRKT